MNLSLDVIRDYIISNKIDNNLDTNKPIKSLGIFKIDKENNNKTWTIRIKPSKDSPYKNGVFSIKVEFPNDFPNSRPEVRFINKIYHLNVNPSNGHIDIYYLINWDKTTTITELLVGIFLIFIFPQNPECPYSGDMARDYMCNQNEFIRKVEEFTNKNAPYLKEDSLQEEINNNEIIIDSLKERIKVLEYEIQSIKNEN